VPSRPNRQRQLSGNLNAPSETIKAPSETIKAPSETINSPPTPPPGVEPPVSLSHEQPVNDDPNFTLL